MKRQLYQGLIGYKNKLSMISQKVGRQFSLTKPDNPATIQPAVAPLPDRGIFMSLVVYGEFGNLPWLADYIHRWKPEEFTLRSEGNPSLNG